jgi:hypothetical protein
MSAILSATTLRLALIIRRGELLRLQKKFPDIYNCEDIHKDIASIDAVLYEIEGNIAEVMISPANCKLNR